PHQPTSSGSAKWRHKRSHRTHHPPHPGSWPPSRHCSALGSRRRSSNAQRQLRQLPSQESRRPPAQPGGQDAMTTSTPRTAAGRIHVSLAQPGDVVHAGRFRHVHVETTSRPLAGKWRVITGTVGTSAVVIRLDANAEVVLVIRPRQYQPTPEMLYGLIAETARTVGHLEAVVGDLDDG